MAPIDLLLVLLIALSVAMIAFALVVRWRIWRGLRAAPPLDRWAGAPEPAGGWPRVAVVVPAHNEERVIARLARSLLEQDYPDLRVVFALDRCTDRTREELERVAGGDSRVSIVEVADCPEGWAGKPHAAHAGYGRSAARDADVVLFTDADTWHHPRCLRAAVAAMRERGAGMLSLLSTLEAEHAWEHAIQPAAVTALLRQHPLDRVNAEGSQRAFANGQYLLFDAETYRAIGGHESVKDAILEDIALAFRCKRTGRRWAVLPAGEMLRCRMYASRAEFLRGWRRIYLESARRLPGRLRAWSVELILTDIALPLASLAGALIGLALVGARDLGLAAALCGGAAVGAWLGATASLWHAQGARVWGAILSPYGSLVVALVMLGAARDLTRRRVVRWGGREYRLEPGPTPHAPPTAPD